MFTFSEREQRLGGNRSRVCFPCIRLCSLSLNAYTPKVVLYLCHIRAKVFIFAGIWRKVAGSVGCPPPRWKILDPSLQSMSFCFCFSHNVAAPLSPAKQEVSCFLDWNVNASLNSLWKVVGGFIYFKIISFSVFF